MASREYHQKYERDRWEKRYPEALRTLGGRCVECGTTEDLQFDHVDPATKLFNISEGATRNENLFWDEVAKCQLLCVPHHKDKTASDGHIWLEGTNNTNNKLRDLDVLYIRELYRLGHSQRAIAREFGVARQTIMSILNGETWSWLKPDEVPVPMRRPGRPRTI